MQSPISTSQMFLQLLFLFCSFVNCCAMFRSWWCHCAVPFSSLDDDGFSCCSMVHLKFFFNKLYCSLLLVDNFWQVRCHTGFVSTFKASAVGWNQEVVKEILVGLYFGFIRIITLMKAEWCLLLNSHTTYSKRGCTPTQPAYCHYKILCTVLMDDRLFSYTWSLDYN